MKPLMVIFLLISLSLGCKPTQTSLQDFTGKQVIIANGGGFTGQVIEYILLDDGRVFKSNSLDRTTDYLKKLDKNVTDQIFNNIEVLELSDLTINDPGNMYYYIKLKSDAQTHVIKWNADSRGSDVDIAKLFYQTVINRLR